ncbi:MAG: hypothetical protein M1401_01925 [Chloroflexi bacterium]|nr:hypothetical protein [Chloroflexota bacterium]MCL5107637.1 hypothetical protein [Chloroflexota bacterium]
MTTWLWPVRNWRTYAYAVVVLALGIACGYAAVIASRPAPRERALIWDDYIVATASLYQRDGDLSGATERLRKIGIEDPGTAVSALAAVYVADPVLGDGVSALRDLAVALTGRNVPQLAAPTPTPARAASPVASLAAAARSPLSWAALCLLAAVWLATAGRSPQRARARRPNYATVPRLPADDTFESEDQTLVESAAAPTAAPSKPATAPVTATLTYRGTGEPYEEMVPINDPRSGKLIGGCGLATGPSAPGVAAGHLGILIWLHESGSAEPPQTLGLVAMPVASASEVALKEWVAYARLPELVVARPGVMKSFETRRLRAIVYILDVATVALGRGNEAVISRLRVHVEVTFKKRPL